MGKLRIPVSTYRLQFNNRFRFVDAQELVPYLAALGITDLYASPIFQARKGSEHGYDTTDPQCLNPELGTDNDFDNLVEALNRHGLGLLQDFPPNHMAASHENLWWMDLLENGPTSTYALYFDVNWQPAGPLSGENKVLLPILGSPYGTALENQEILLSLDDHGFWANYHANKFPLGTRTYNAVLSHGLGDLEAALGADNPAYLQLHRLIKAVEELPSRTMTDPEEMKIRLGGKETIKERLWQAYTTYQEIRDFLDENIRIFNGRKGDSRSFDLLDRLLDAQPYRLAYWRVASDRVAYRRFFDISDLVGIHPEVPQVFQAVHSLLMRLVAEGKVTGLRIDHVDGLYDPMGYLIRLQSQLGAGEADIPEPRPNPGFYVIVEKILMNSESLPQDWPTYGTTGYDFANQVNEVMVDAEGLEQLGQNYRRLAGVNVSFDQIVCEKKRQAIQELFSGEMRALARRLIEIAETDRHARDLNPDDLALALREIIACFPVYRTYIRAGEISDSDRANIIFAVREAGRCNPEVNPAVFKYLRCVLLLESPPTLTARQREAWMRFVTRWQQFTGPIMAKGLEDTAAYVYSRLISLNEVGGRQRAMSVNTFHERNQDRRARWPHTMNATSTHDTKRSEDVRARINVLSEIPGTWARHLRAWRRWNKHLKSDLNGAPAPDANEEVFFYQTLLGAWPFDDSELPRFAERIRAYMTKAMREAKVHTSWTDASPDYENAVLRFIEAVMTPSSGNRFLPDFLRFQKKIAFYGAWASLSQVLLKITSPGVPDFYQGTELWDLSLVDPDNRRAVDFTGCRHLLDELILQDAKGTEALVSRLQRKWRDGRIKLFVTFKSLRFRRAESALFQQGEYLPLAATELGNEHLISYARSFQHRWAVVATPRLLARLYSPGRPPLGSFWGNSSIVLPPEAPETWQNVLTGEQVACTMESGRRILKLSDVFRQLPLGLLSGIGRRGSGPPDRTLV